jgi:bis(5'-nucleosyl)-tetraphosphatase (symmetrical)
LAQYAIGDLQGCYDPFRRLLDKISFDPAKDKLWLTGDLVNRGPKSRRTLRFVKSLGSSAVTVLGNHDLHLLTLAHDVKYTKARFDALWKILGREDSDELLDWLRMQPLAHYDKDMNTLMVHAGIPPTWTVKKTLARAAEVEVTLRGDGYGAFLDEMYGDKPDLWSGKLEGANRIRFIINALTRMRMIDADGRIDFTHTGPPDSAGKGLLPWYAAANARWRGTRIVFGHWSALGLVVNDEMIAVDTGCVWGRQLTAVKLTGKAKSVTVQCSDVSS